MNWGYKLMIVFIAFACMMGYMVYRCYGTKFDLVENEYYKSELKYQDVIDGTQQAERLSSTPQIKQQGDDLQLQLPEEMKHENVSGTVLFYCAYDASKDKTIPLSVDANGAQSFTRKIAPGVYTVKINWQAAGKNYYAEKNITVL
ncbi:MAG: FixH family protein [Chitinophagaceae bacterium]